MGTDQLPTQTLVILAFRRVSRTFVVLRVTGVKRIAALKLGYTE